MADFVRYGTTTLYLPDGSTLDTARLGYLLPGATADRIGLLDALDVQKGWFIFVPGFPAVADMLDAFLTAATSFLQAPGRENVRFAWFDDPTARPLQGFTIALTGSAGAWTTPDRVDVVFANYALRLARSNTIAVDGTVTGLTFTAPSGDQNALLASPLAIGPQTTFPITGAVTLPLIVPSGGGCFGFATSSDDAGLTALDAGIRYFMSSYDTPGYVDTLRYPVFDLASAGPQAAAGDATSFALTGSFDPVDQTDAARTNLQIATGGAPARTYYRNALGEVVRATPRADAALVFRSVLTAEPVDGDTGDGNPYYLAPLGSFAVTAGDATAALRQAQDDGGQAQRGGGQAQRGGGQAQGDGRQAQGDGGQAQDSFSRGLEAVSRHPELVEGSGLYRATLMAGLSGAEYAALAEGATNVLRFEPNGAAYAPATFQQPTGGDVRVTFSGLSTDATTSYANIYAESPTVVATADAARFDVASAATDTPPTLTYFAQPDSAVLHQPGGGDAEFLSYLALPAGALPPPPAASSSSLPVASSSSSPVASSLSSPAASSSSSPVTLSLSKGRSSEGAPQPFPLAPYAGTALPAVSFFRDLELKLLSPARRTAIAASGPPPASAAQAFAAVANRSTTPQGLLLERDGDDWTTLTLAQSQLADGTTEDLNLHDVHGDLREALQSNQLFLVASDATAFLNNASVEYAMSKIVRDQLVLVAQVPSAVVDRLAPLDGTSYEHLETYREAVLRLLSPYVLTDNAMLNLALVPGIPTEVVDALKPLVGTTYPSYDAIATAIANVLTPADYATWVQVVIGYAAVGFSMYQDQPVTYGYSMLASASRFHLTAAGYVFDLSPYSWSAYRTILIFKFANGRLRDLVDDTTTWANPTAFNASVPAVQQQLQATIADADPSDPDMQYFVNTVLDDPGWNGVLALSARVPLDGLPQELAGLAAGIDPAEFVAHHVGITVTPIVPDPTTGLAAKPSTIFGLIDYESSGMTDTTPAYQFEVLQLKVLLANSAVADFASKVQLLVNQLFGESAKLRGASASILTFLGSYVKSGSAGGGSYLFTNDDVNVFDMPTSAVLQRIVVSRAQFVTLTPAAGADTELVESQFLLAGSIVFRAIAGFDVFSFGSDDPTSNAGLTYTNLSVDLSFNSVTPSYKTFTFDTSAIAFDVATSTARAASLYRHFPLQLTGLSAGGADTRPDKANFMPVQTPMAGSGGLRETWYGLAFSLNLGTPGALAAEIGFTAGFVAAWSPTDGALAVFVGLSIPGVKNGRRAISLQGVLTLNFGDLSFVVNGTSYILEMRTITLSVLSLSFPPTGQTSILLFGDPSGADRETLGWYAAFNKPTNSSAPASPPLGGLPAGVLQWSDHARRDVVPLADLVQPVR